MSIKQTLNPWNVWFIAVLFLLFQFLLQLSSGVVLDQIMMELKYNAFYIGLLSSAFYFIYTALQIPVGLLFDKYQARNLLSINCLICATGCLIFAFSYHFDTLFLGRFLMGAGSAFAFIGVTYLIRNHFPLNQFAFMMGLSETLGLIVTVIAMMLMSLVMMHWGWRGFMCGAGITGLVIAWLCRRKIPLQEQSNRKHAASLKQVLDLFKNPLLWANGLFCGLGFAIITVFGALWAVPFLKIKLDCSLFIASCLAAMIFLGAAIGLPFIGRLYERFYKRKPLIWASCLLTAFWVSLVILIPGQHIILHGLLLFLSGLTCGGYILAFAIALELCPKNSESSATGFTNTFSVITAPLLQPLIGYLLDYNHLRLQLPILISFQAAMMIIPLALIIAAGLVCYLPEKNN